MLKEKVQAALNGQLNMELYSAYIYMSVAAYFEAEGLQGMATWHRMQLREELLHAEKFANFISERGGRVILAPIDGPKTEWSSALDAFEDAYAHECKVSALIDGLVDLAIEERDHATNAFLQWFVSEQVEEEASVLEVVDKLKLAGDHKGALFMIDKELSARPAPAAPTAG